MSEVISELNRYSDVKLRVDDPQLTAERLSGVFAAGDQALFSESLALYLPVETAGGRAETAASPALPDTAAAGRALRLDFAGSAVFVPP